MGEAFVTLHRRIKTPRLTFNETERCYSATVLDFSLTVRMLPMVTLAK